MINNMIGKVSRTISVVAVVLLTAATVSSCYKKPDLGNTGGIVTAREYHDPVRIGTYNIQYDNLNDAANPWSSRRVILENILEEMDLDIFGAQEPYRNQIEDMMQYLGDDYAWTGKNINGRTDQNRVHYNPIFYKKDRFTIVKEGMFWFSETPDAPSKFSDSYSVRMCCWVHFKDTQTGVEFYHFNCHFDHIGSIARTESGKLVPSKIKEISGELPAFLTGDFNSNQRTTAYNNILGSGTVVDSYSKAAARENDKWHTFNGYNYAASPPANANRIDHLFVKPDGAKVVSWKIVNTAYSQKYPSDHYPVIVEWAFEKQTEN